MESRPANEITFEYVSNRLLGEFHRQAVLADESISSEPKVLYTKSNSFKPKKQSSPVTACSHCGRSGHPVSKCWDLHPEQRPVKEARDTLHLY